VFAFPGKSTLQNREATMNKRIAIKTALICFGVFIMLCAGIVYYFSQNYQLDLEKKYNVAVATKSIGANEIINESMITIKTIKQSALVKGMVSAKEDLIGSKTIAGVEEGDYYRNYLIVPKDKIFRDDDRIIILPMDVEDRLAGLVQEGSIVDIIINFKDQKAPKRVLSKININSLIDENGISIEKNEIGAKKVFAKLVLNDEQRMKVYIARVLGKLTFELYCDATQKRSIEDFVVPVNFEAGIK
jgi:Flp pilus assembly protein CpaB